MEELKKEIIQEIESQGYFSFFPNRWEKYSEAIDSLEQETIEKLSNFCGSQNNNHYFYVLKGNPQNIHWVNTPNGARTILRKGTGSE